MKTLAEQALAALKALSEPPSSKVEEIPEKSVRVEMAVAPASLPLCGDPNCAGCYEVEPGRRIHPRKSRKEWLDWLARWQPKSEAAKQ